MVSVLGLQALFTTRDITVGAAWDQAELQPGLEHELKPISREDGVIEPVAAYRDDTVAPNLASGEYDNLNATDLGFSDHTPPHLALLASEGNTSVLVYDPSQSAEFLGIEDSTPQHLLHHKKMAVRQPTVDQNSQWHPDSRGHSVSLHRIPTSPDPTSLDSPATSSLADHRGFAPDLLPLIKQQVGRAEGSSGPAEEIGFADH